ncbi:MAG TPA: peptidylprolyl isomerase [Bryobacteraceae bacterium]|nr:peptidylprolyl isomerase [Bryobacteraceae bacterium]
MRTSEFLLVTCVCALALGGCKTSTPDNIAATVNSRPITNADVDKHFQLNFPDAQSRPADDQMMIQKLEIVRTLIDNEILLQRAEKLSLMATEADVEAKFNELKSGYTQEEFQRTLDARKMTVADLKAQLKRDLSVQKLINKEITSQISISDAQIAEFFKANKDAFNLAEPQIHLAQIVVTSSADPNVRNLKNDDAATDEQAKSKVQALEARLRQGEDFSSIAQNFSEDPSSAANGGDLGFIPQSALDQAGPEARALILQVPSGQISRPVGSQGSYRIFKVVSKEPAGQRELNDPKVQQRIRETLLNRKDQLLKAAYYEVARNEANVVNHYALRVTQNSAKK